MKKTLFIVNPISGTKSKQEILDLIPQFFEQGSYEIAHTEYAGHGEEMARKAANDGRAEIIVAVGGDGTVNEVARGLAHTPAALGIIPCGSGNGLARHLGISMNPRKALETLKRAEIRVCDYGKINGHPFFCTAGVGFDAEVSDTFARAGKRGLITYLKTTILVGLRYRGETLDVEFDDGETLRNKRFWLVTTGNAAQYGNDFFITPGASVCDGVLDVNIWSPFSKIFSPVIGLRMFLGSIDKFHSVRVKRCKSVTIHRQNAGAVHYDGDPAKMEREIKIEVVEKGIRMVVGCPSKNLL